MIVQKKKPLMVPLMLGESPLNAMARLMTSKTGNFSMLVGKVVRKNLATSAKFISLNAWPTVIRFTKSRLTKGSHMADKIAATKAAVQPCAAAAKTLLKKLSPSSGTGGARGD